MRGIVALALLLSSLTATAGTDGGRTPEVLFTFDDGPSPQNTTKILDVLDVHGIKSIFFVNGWHFQGKSAGAERSRALLREELARGHAVGNHTVHHYFLCGHLYSKRISSEVMDNAALIEEATGVRPDLFRTPYGAHCRHLNQTLDELGVRPIGWDIDPQDWRLRDPRKIELYVEKHLRALHGRAILLLHDVQPATAIALPRVLDWIDRENARRAVTHEAAIRIINYDYLLPRPSLPLLQALGRLLSEAARRWATTPVPICPLAWI